MRILICSNVYPPKFVGGAEIIAHRQALALQKQGHSVAVFSGDIREIGQRHHYFCEEYDGIVTHRVRLTHEDFMSDDVNFVHRPVDRYFEDVLDEFQPDVVHCHNLIGLSVNIPIIAKQHGVKVAVTLHDHWGYCYKNTAEVRPGVICQDHRECAKCMPYFGAPSGRRLPIEMRTSYLRYALTCVDQFISPSQYLADKYVEAGFPAENMAVVWNGIDTDRFQTLLNKPRAKALRLSFFGYLGRHKGLNVLLEAVSRLDNPRKVRINLVGEGDQEAGLRELATALGIVDLVRFWGKVSNDQIEEPMGETDVLVLPSIWPENQPVSITEGMASGIPVIASDIGGIPELVRDGETGFTFKVGNADDLAEKIQLLIDNPHLRQTLGEGGRELIEAHSFAAQTAELVRLYEGGGAAPVAPPSDAVGVMFGKEASPLFAQGLKVLHRLYPEVSVVTALDEWLVDRDSRRAIFACAMDPAASLEEANFYTQSGLPLLFPEGMPGEEAVLSNDEFKLSYRSATDLAGQIAYVTRAMDGRIDEQ